MGAALRQRGFIRAWAATALASTFGQALGLFVPMAAAATFGASAASDQVFVALAVATFITTTLAGATQFAAVPFFVDSLNRNAGAEFLRRCTRLVLVSALFFCAAASIGLGRVGRTATFADPLTRGYLLALAPFTVAAAISSLFVGALNASRDYVPAALSMAWRWVTVLAFVLVLGSRVGAVVLIAGYTAGEAARLSLLWLRVRRRYEPRKAAGAGGPGLIGFVRAAAGQLAASGMLAIVPVIDRAMAGRLPAGNVTLLEYADRIWQIPVGLAMSGLLVVVLTKWSEDAFADDGLARLAVQTRRGALVIALVAVLPCAALAWQRQWLTQLLFGYRSLSTDALAVLADALGFFAVGIPPYLAALVYTRAFLALQRSEWMAVVAASELLLKLAINPWCLRWLGLPGLAAATAIMYGAGLVVLIAAFEIMIGRQILSRRSRGVPR